MKGKTIICKLISPQLQKTEVIAGLKNDILERKELKKGYSYKFKATDTYPIQCFNNISACFSRNYGRSALK